MNPHESGEDKSETEKQPPESQPPPLAIDKLPATVWVVAIAGAAERFCYYALATPLRMSFISKTLEAFTNHLLQKITYKTQEATSRSRELLVSDSRRLQI